MIAWLATALGLSASLGLLAISAAMNFRFGLTLGTTELDALIYGCASVCADLLKALLPFIILAGWREHRFLLMLLASLLWSIFTLYSFTSGIGFAALNRATLTSERTVTTDRYAELTKALADAQGRLDALPAHRPSALVAQELENLRQNPRWKTSLGCSNATVSLSISFCRQFADLKAEVAAAQEAATLRTEIKELQETRAGLPPTSAMHSADPQLAILDDLLGLGPERLGIALSLLVAVLVEFGSGLGPYLSTAFHSRPKQANHHHAPKSARQSTSVPALPTSYTPGRATPEEVWRKQRIAAKQGVRTPITRLYADYLSWCSEKLVMQPLTLTAFTSWLSEHAQLRMIDVGPSKCVEGNELLQ